MSISDRDFARVCDLAMRHAGISMSGGKKSLVEGRLRKRVLANGLPGYGEYLQLLARPESQAELQTAIDLLTTNETSFFREPKHFEHLRSVVRTQRQYSVAYRVWSAACSSGEEPYTIAMVLADAIGQGEWEVAASDLSTRVLAQGREAHYPMERAGRIPKEFLHRYCLRGTGPQDGTFMMDSALKRRVRFRQANLLQPVSQAEGLFDAIFLRNVMIYFDTDTKRKVVGNLLPALKPGGLLYIGHSETINNMFDNLQLVQPAIYKKLER